MTRQSVMTQLAWSVPSFSCSTGTFMCNHSRPDSSALSQWQPWNICSCSWSSQSLKAVILFYCYCLYKTNPSPSFPVQPSLVCLSMLSVNPLLQWTKRYKSWLSYSAIPGVTSVPFCAVSQVDGLHERTLSRKTASQLFWGPFLIAGPLQSWPKFLQFSPHCRNILNWIKKFIIF